jgi:hypothetical protein
VFLNVQKDIMKTEKKTSVKTVVEFVKLVTVQDVKEIVYLVSMVNIYTSDNV